MTPVLKGYQISAACPLWVKKRTSILYSITRSAIESTPDGTSMPRARSLQVVADERGRPQARSLPPTAAAPSTAAASAAAASKRKAGAAAAMTAASSCYSARAAAASALGCKSYALAEPRFVFPVEDIERRQADVRNFLLIESNYGTWPRILRRYIRCRWSGC